MDLQRSGPQKAGAAALSALVESTSTPAFIVDRGTLVAWNRSAQAFFGHAPEAVLGMPCCEVLAGRDSFGNRFCGRNCALRRMARRRDPLHDFEVDFATATSLRRQVIVSSVALTGSRGGERPLLHLVWPLDERMEAGPAAPGAPDEAMSPPAGFTPLTARELEVLRMLSAGRPTRGIAAALFISVKTVRNHIQNILHKLGAHSRLEAIALAHRARLL